jgi:hypothetical protein
MQPLGDAVDKQVDHFELGQIGLANASYSAHSRRYGGEFPREQFKKRGVARSWSQTRA